MSHEYFHHVSICAHVTNARGATVYTRCYMLLKLATIALLRYLWPIDNALGPQGPLTHSVPSVVISKVNREVKKAETRTKKRGSYLSFTAEPFKGQCTEDVLKLLEDHHARLESKALHLDRTRTRNHVHVRTLQSSHYVIRDRNSRPTKFKTTKILF